MKYGLSLLILLLAGINLSGQNLSGKSEGSISFITSQSVYIKFKNPSKIKAGDTLFIKQGDNLVPVLKVKDLSTISCVCIPISQINLKISDQVFSKPAQVPVIFKEESAIPLVPVRQDSVNHMVASEKTDSVMGGNPMKNKNRHQIHGSVSLASYTNWSNYSSANSQREKLTFSLSAKNIDNSDFSAECYLSYNLNNKQWNEISNSIFNNLKIYNFGFSYDFGHKATLFLGRKINPKLSNMGANDGLQLELKFKPLSIGIIAGFRPDFKDYGFNANFFQFGTFLYNEYAGKRGFMQTTLAFINQTNTWKTDRRFIYIQHINSLVKNLTFFGSAEMDIYGKTFNHPDSSYTSKSTTKLSSLYLSLNYRMLKRLSISLSYSARKNVIYYETYKNFLERLLDTQTLQGYILQVTYTPVNKFSIGATGTYRFQKQDPRDTKNLYLYLNYTQIPGINTSITVSVITMSTGYLDGRIYGAQLSKDLASGKLYLGLGYRYVNYQYFNTEYIPSYQNMGEFSLTWRILRKLALSIYYEGTYEKVNQYNRIYTQLHLGF